MHKSILFLVLTAFLFSCNNETATTTEETVQEEAQFITLYTHRHYDTDKEIFKKFEEQTGIEVKVVKASADELIQKMESEGDQSPADLILTVDAGRLVQAKSKGLLQSIQSETLNTIIPAHLRDTDNQWFSLTKRARVIVYNKDKVSPTELSTYEALSEAQWKKRILIRSSENIYNQSLMASIIANDGEEKAQEWAAGMVANFARSPKGNDRDQVKAILAGEGDIAIINTYYLGKLLTSSDATEVEAGKAVDVFFPNQDGRGTHINVSGIGVAKNAPNKENAVKFIEFLLSKESQEMFANVNYEYPVNAAAETAELLNSWGTFKEDQLPLSKLGELNKEAVILFDVVGWQ